MIFRIQPHHFAVPGYFLPWAVNAGIQAFGLHVHRDISTTEPYLQHRGRGGRVRARDIPFMNITNQIVMTLPALIQARRECCQTLIDNMEWDRATYARCI